LTQLWQILDSGFPAGSFAHSAGLEAAWQSGEVATEAEFAAFLRDSLWHTGRSALPLVTAAHREPERFVDLDGICDATLTNRIANRASRAQGRAWLGACARIWPSPTLALVETTARSGYGHYAPAVGVALREYGVPLDQTQRVFLFTATRSICSAGVRLGITGPYRAQRLQYDAQQDLERVLECCRDLTVDQLSHTAPLIDLLQSTHDRLYSRLFQS
jgi:urease accessory protein